MPDFNLIFGGTALMTVLILGGTCLTILVSFAFTGAILWFTLRPLMQNAQNRSNLMQAGIPATAMVMSLSETGMLVNNQPQVKIVLQVHPQNGVPYQTDLVMVISMLQIPRVQPGMVVPVKIDPKNPANVAVAI